MKITKERLKQIIKEELEEISRGRQPRLQKGRPAVDDREYYDPNHLELEKEVDAMNLGDDLGKFPHDPTYDEKRAFITRINKRLQKAQDRETINKLRDLKRKIDLFSSVASQQRARRGAVRDSDRDPMFRRGVTEARLKEMIKEEASKTLNEVITVRDIERMLPSGVMAEYPGAANILQRRALAAKMSREELTQKIKAARIKDGEHPRQFFRRLGFEYDLKEEKLNEELTRQDKTDVKKMVQDELEKLLKKKDTKDQMGEIVKKIMKKLYKDLSLEHPYIIDRIKI